MEISHRLWNDQCQEAKVKSATKMSQVEHCSTSCGNKHKNLMTADCTTDETAVWVCCQINIHVTISSN